VERKPIKFSLVWWGNEFRRVGKDGVTEMSEVVEKCAIPMIEVLYDSGKREWLNAQYLHGMVEAM
jgi:hypothetical protein